MPQPGKNWSYLNSNIDLSKNFVHSFIFAKEAYRVNLIFGLIEYEGSLNDPSILKSLGEKINTYYFDDDIWSEEISGELQELQFSNTLQKINNRINNLVNNYEGWDPKKLRLVIASLLEENKNSDRSKLCLSFAGKENHVLIFHELKNGLVKAVDVLEGNENHEPFNPLKIFSHIVTGQLTPADKITISSQSLFDTVSWDEIKKTVSSLQPMAALEHLKNQVNKASFSFSGLIIRPTESPVVSVNALGGSGGKRGGSVQKILHVEKETEKFLAPALGLNFFSSVRKMGKRTASVFSFFGSEAFSNKTSLFKSKVSKFFGAIADGWREFYPRALFLIKSALSGLVGAVRFLISLIVKLSVAIKKAMGWVYDRLLTGIRLARQWFSRLTLKQKLSLVGGIILIAIFFQSASWVLAWRQGQKEELAYQKTVADIKNKFEAADSALIYKDEDKARNQIVLAETLIKGLPLNSAARKTQHQSLENTAKSKLKLLRKEVVFTPVKIAEITDMDLRKIIVIDNKVVVAGNQPALATVDVQGNHDITKITRVWSTTKTWNFAVANDEEAYFFDQGGKLIAYNIGTGKFETRVTPLKTNFNIADISLYDRKLYVLERGGPQIYRFGRATGGFAGEAVPFLRQKNVGLVPVASAFAVNNEIYLANHGGSITKLASGGAEPSVIGPINVEPLLTAPTRILSLGQYLYVLEPSTQRLVVISKAGVLVAQYVNAEFTDLRDFALDGSGKAYLLNENQVVEIDINI